MPNEISLVLGAGGFLGRTLCDALLAKEERVRGVECAHSTTNNGDVDWWFGDVQDEEFLRQAMAGCHTVFHLVSATIPSTSNQNVYHDCEANVLTSLKILDIAVESGVQKIVFTSSGGTVYGISGSLPIQEGAPTLPICAYGISKLMIEKYMHLYSRMHALQSVVLRISNPYGPYQRLGGAQGVIGTFIGKAMQNEQIEIWGDGKTVRDYVFADDVAEAMCKAKEVDHAFSVFNIGAGKGYNLLDILCLIEENLGRTVKVIYKDSRDFDVPEIILDVSLAKEQLGWEPKTSLESGIEQVIEYHQTHGEISGISSLDNVRNRA